MMRPIYSLILFVILFSDNNLAQVSFEPDSFYSDLKYRCIGPFRGGRSVCASGVIGDQVTYYMGTTGGGLWKTSDAGQHWKNISDGYFKTGSVGAIAVSESQPQILYCGMGEHAPRGVMTSHGDGVYKSNDAGKTWSHMGLEKTQHISRIIIHPNDPNIVYVAAQGALYGPNKERGIYKSLDGGKTWQNILFINDLTGCSELSIDYNNPNVLYAAMWEHQRKPWKVISGGEGSGLYKSSDGGQSWKKIHKGLPKEKGKMAISVSRSNPEKVYALIESDTQKDKSGLFVSNTGGRSWSRVSTDNRLTQRAWYYTEVFIDPIDENTVYVLSAPALKSIDGGKNWSLITGTHGDYHDLWINPSNSKNMVIANDGGAAISFNGGKSWSTQDNMPTAQFYRISVDSLFPYNIYGGQQDNSSVRISSQELNSSSIGPRSWTYSAGGESAFLAFDPKDPKYVMGGSYLGTIEVLDMEAQAETNVMSAPIQYLGMEARQMKYLYNWNAPIIKSMHEKETYFHCSQYVLRSHDMGQKWEEVSPDLTRNIDDKQGNGGGPYTNEAVGAENYGTISYMKESPHEHGVYWIGSDDGLVHITRDNCKNWTNVTPKGLKECLINAIEVSPHDPATAYIATTRYKFDDKTPAIYKTTNYGKSWNNISNNIPYGAYTRVVREDDIKKNLLFAGTETGIYYSINGGQKWQSLQLNLPITPILDLAVTHGDLVVGTSGRSFWILDDLGLLRQHTYDRDKINLFKPDDNVLNNSTSPLDGNTSRYKNNNFTSGVNPPSGIVFYYYLPKKLDSIEVALTILDSSGKEINTFSSNKNKDYKRYDGGPPSEPLLKKNAGLNRFVWNMRNATLPGIENAYIEGSYRGHKVSPGKYTAVINAGENEKEVSFNILRNPLYPASIDYSNYDQFMTEMEINLKTMHELTNELHKKKSQLIKIRTKVGKENKRLFDEIDSTIEKLKAWDEEMVQRKTLAYDDVENFPNKFTANYLFLINQSESAIPRINEGSKQRRLELDAKWSELEKQGMYIKEKLIPELNQSLWESGIGAIWDN